MPAESLFLYMELSKEFLQSLRQDYRAATLSIEDVDPNPVNQFEKWFKEALNAQLFEPNVMTLATVDADMRPNARIVLLKGFDESGFSFYTNYQSNKGSDLEVNPHACLVFFWADLQRQVRINGDVVKLDEQSSTEYFHSRPIGSQIGAWASPQSRVIADRRVLEKKVEELSRQYEGQLIPKPEYWGGYLVKPHQIEFWQGRSSRLHDRIQYQKENGNWKISRLAP